MISSLLKQLFQEPKPIVMVAQYNDILRKREERLTRLMFSFLKENDATNYFRTRLIINKIRKTRFVITREEDSNAQS